MRRKICLCFCNGVVYITGKLSSLIPSEGWKSSQNDNLLHSFQLVCWLFIITICSVLCGSYFVFDHLCHEIPVFTEEVCIDLKVFEPLLKGLSSAVSGLWLELWTLFRFRSYATLLLRICICAEEMPSSFVRFLPPPDHGILWGGWAHAWLYSACHSSWRSCPRITRTSEMPAGSL